MVHRFYGQHIDTPLSAANNLPGWDSSIIGRLYKQSDGAVHIGELSFMSETAAYAWRVVDAQYIQEDGIISYFRAYDLDGAPLPQATFGVTWDSCPHRIVGGFRFRPEAGNRYYVPVANNFVTHASGGYRVQVLDLDYPSEVLAFGLKKDKDHHALVVSFRLFEVRPGYPNDL